MNLTLKVWRQKNPEDHGRIETYEAADIPETASFLEMLDIVNERIIRDGGDPVAFDHDCREGICGMCSLVINGIPHGPNKGVTTCQLHMRSFADGDTIPFRKRSKRFCHNIALCFLPNRQKHTTGSKSKTTPPRPRSQPSWTTPCSAATTATNNIRKLKCWIIVITAGNVV